DQLAQLFDALRGLAVLLAEVCELVHGVAVGQAHCRPQLTSTRGRICATSIGTPPLLVRDCQARPNASIGSTLAGPRMRVPDWIFALCRTLLLLSIFWRFVGARVSPPKNAFRERPLPNSRIRHRDER